jgi:membrane protein insertase Oxa1/YidC/SpoIIIJ
MPLHMVYMSLVQRLSFNYDINPAILSEGFWWFKDLSSPDPTGILPVMGGLVSMLSMMSSSTSNTN